MIINEDYFNDLEIKDEDIATDDMSLDVGEPLHELTLEEAQKLPEQYDYCIRINIHIHKISNSNISTTLLPKLFKRLDTIFEMYGIEHSLYVLSYREYLWSMYDNIVDFGNYKLFCSKYDKDLFVNDEYDCVLIRVYVKYPKFNYKRAFRFVYAMLNIFRLDKHIEYIHYVGPRKYCGETANTLRFYRIVWGLEFNDSTWSYVISLYKKLTVKDKKIFYKNIMCHFFGEGVRVPYMLIDKDVPLKPLRL